jgi:hypothetical protein
MTDKTRFFSLPANIFLNWRYHTNLKKHCKQKQEKIGRESKQRIGSHGSGLKVDQAINNHSFLSFCVSVGLMDAALKSAVNAEDNVLYET